MMTLEELDKKMDRLRYLKQCPPVPIVIRELEELENIRIGSFDLTEKKPEVKAFDEISEMIKVYTAKNNKRPEILYLPNKLIEKLKNEITPQVLYDNNLSKLAFWGVELRAIEDHKYIFGNNYER